MSHPKQGPKSDQPPTIRRRRRPARYRHANRENFERLERYRPLHRSIGALKVKAEFEEDAIANMGDSWPVEFPFVDLKLFRE
ncbi:MAG: hypothetical protein AAGJ95_10420 [Cyanobacteria bacterium J06554_11]